MAVSARVGEIRRLDEEVAEKRRGEKKDKEKYFFFFVCYDTECHHLCFFVLPKSPFTAVDEGIVLWRCRETPEILPLPSKVQGKVYVRCQRGQSAGD